MVDYPLRRPMPPWARYLCMALGIGNIIGGLSAPFDSASNQMVPDAFGFSTFGVLGGLLVGGLWFAFGYFGGLPLVDTVSDWQPPNNSEEITDSYRRGIVTLGRRKRLMWASIPAYFVLAGLLMPWFLQIKQGGVGFLLIATVIITIYLSAIS